MEQQKEMFLHLRPYGGSVKPGGKKQQWEKQKILAFFSTRVHIYPFAE